MHDVVRDMAIWISSAHSHGNSDKWVVHAGGGINSFRSTIPWSKAECVSLMWSNMTELPSFGPNNCSTKLRTLYLQGNSLDERSIGAIQNLTALTCLDLSFNHLCNIPEEFCALANLQYLNLSGNDGITEVPVRLAELTKLKFFSLGGTSVEYIPTEVISSNKNLQVLDLITLGSMPSYNTIAIIEVLCPLTGLKAVDIAIGSDDEYDILCKEAKIPIRDLFIQKSIKTPRFCLSGDIFSYDIARRTIYELTIKGCPMNQIMLGHELGRAFDALSLLVLSNLRDLKQIKWNGISSPALFPNLTQLRIDNCTKLQHISWAMYFSCLEDLYVYGCHNLEKAFLSTEDCGVKRHEGLERSEASIGTFPCLKHLEFWDNSKLASLFDTNVTFPSMETLKFLCCPELKTLSFKMESLPPKLKKLEMDNDSAWNTLEWEEDEDVKTSLRRFLTVRNN